MVKKNVHAAITPLNATEERVHSFIQNNFFKTLQLQHWEGVEVENYWNSKFC